MIYLVHYGYEVHQLYSPEGARNCFTTNLRLYRDRKVWLEVINNDAR